jgi:Nucleotidyl transferase AbiEii toxin, Type IV TA system
VDTSKLAPETKRVWEFLSNQNFLEEFILIGGSALTLRIGHRISEDLDFVCLSPRLPRAALDHAVRLMESYTFRVERNDSQASYEECLIAGQSLHDSQQDFLVNGVKISFFTAPKAIAALLEPAGTGGGVRVATLPELFRTKSLAAASRCMSRDWLDLYVLFREHGFTTQDFHAVFQREGILGKETLISQAFNNLCRGKATPKDPGFENLMSDPPSLLEIADYFGSIRNDYEVWLTRVAFESETGDSASS